MRGLILRTTLGAAPKHTLATLAAVTLSMIIAATLFSWMFQAYVL